MITGIHRLTIEFGYNHTLHTSTVDHWITNLPFLAQRTPTREKMSMSGWNGLGMGRATGKQQFTLLLGKTYQNWGKMLQR